VGSALYTGTVTAAAKKVLEDALALSEVEREALMEAIGRSLPPMQISEPWKAELTRRVEAIESGRAVLQDAEAHARALGTKFGSPL